MAVQGKRKSGSYPVLKMPLDLANPVDAEVHQIFSNFRNGVEAKNYILSAILYYSRSPLVLTANALTDALKGADGRFDKISRKLDELSKRMVSIRVADVEQSSVSVGTDEVFTTEACIPTDDTVKTELRSLKQKFKI